MKEIGPHSSSYTPRNATSWHVLQSGTLLRFTVTYVSLTTLKRSGIAMPTSTGLPPMKTWIDWPVWTFTNLILKFLNFTTMGMTGYSPHFLSLWQCRPTSNSQIVKETDGPVSVGDVGCRCWCRVVDDAEPVSTRQRSRHGEGLEAFHQAPRN